jgi:2-polyprenyl-6-methoxyphenol hydroxylase-like FAD-dependent oxidoreductase
MLLARAGHSVLVVDRATFPSDTLSTHFVTPDGTARLRDWGLLDRIIATGCPPIPKTRMRIGVTDMPSIARPEAFGICPRRTVLDNVLIGAAREAGAEVREGFAVTALTFDGHTVTGVRGHGSDGVEVTESARIVIGADGKNAWVARAVGAPEYNQAEGATCGYYSYWSGVENDGSAELFVIDGRGIFLFPTHDGLVCIAMERPAAEFAVWKKDIDGYMLARMDEAVPEFAARVRAGKREEHFRGFTSPPSLYRKPFGPGWALAGDAGFYKDPILGQGITDAFQDAGALSTALISAWRGDQPIEEALAGYETQRNAATAITYQLTNLLAARLDPPAEVAMMMQMGMRPQAQPA